MTHCFQTRIGNLWLDFQPYENTPIQARNCSPSTAVPLVLGLGLYYSYRKVRQVAKDVVGALPNTPASSFADYDNSTVRESHLFIEPVRRLVPTRLYESRCYVGAACVCFIQRHCTLCDQKPIM